MIFNSFLKETCQTGKRLEPLCQFNEAINLSNTLSEVEPTNAKWIHYGFSMRLSLVDHLLSSGQAQQAAAPANEACAAVQSLLTRKVPIAWGRGGVRECWTMRARIALALRQKDAALDNSRRALGGALAVHSSDPAADRFGVARAHRLLGDSERELGDRAAASAAWQNALADVPHNVAEKPSEMREHATILERLGRTAEALPLTAKLSSIGYRLQM